MNKTVVFDFDGVIHSYTSGWKGIDIIPDEPVEGIENALKEIHEAGYEVAIVSTRCSSNLGADAIKCWLNKYNLFKYIDIICKEKPPAIVYIDDRAICFDGRPEKLLSKIENFVPWNKKKNKNFDGKIFRYVADALDASGTVKRVVIDDKVFIIIDSYYGLLLSDDHNSLSHIPMVNFPEDTISDILNKDDRYMIVNISAKFKDGHGNKVRKLTLNNGDNIYVNNKYYKKFKKFKLYGGEYKTSAIKAYDDNDNLVGFFTPFHPDYFEKRYGETD